MSVSNTTPPVAGNEVSEHPSISADGRYVAFTSNATNLTNETGAAFGTSQVYVRDTVSGTTRMVSATPAGVAGNRISFSPSISADGRLVAFVSMSTNLSPGAVGQVFLWSADTGAVEVVSVSNDAVPQVANATAQEVVMSADGTTVAWSTSATNLTPENTWGYRQVYVRDLTDHMTALVSRDTTVTPVTGAQANAFGPTISADGNLIAFITSWKLTGLPAPNQEAYVRDRVHDAIQLVSLNFDGIAGVNRDVSDAALSADGQHLAYSSGASDAVDSTMPGRSAQIFVRDLQAGTTQFGSIGIPSGGASNFVSKEPSISPDGRLVAYASQATNIVPEGSSFPPATFQVYVTDLMSHTSVLVSRAQDSNNAGGRDSANPAISSDGRRVAFSSVATNLTPIMPSGFAQVYARDVQDPSSVERVGGADRYEVSAAVSASTFNPGVKDVFVASGEVFSDALSGSAIAGLRQAPVLLVAKDHIPASVAAELTRLKPGSITVLGGEATINATVEADLRTYSANVSRIAGTDRYAVSAAIADTFAAGPAVAYVASGAVFPDALSGSAAAGMEKGPVLLVGKDEVPASVTTALSRLAPKRIVVLGGVNTVSDAVVAALNGTAPTTRIGGSDRYAVSAGVAAAAFTLTGGTVYIASGATFPDALSGSAAAIAGRSPVLLVTATSVPDPVAAELRRLKPRHIVVLGGPNTVSDALLTALNGYLAP
ncbi:cell wall-binding repeat-containing protein [Herbiconiux ginsengi]|uniref:cell wall-binding repeat-containing protein n=1 Tax=Herbiconiux ginsengi TaxID=381665 RepID=UPI001587A6EF|nr:cell wall-binding repeat-containing protein [Herbiconiux ginsengi]